MQLSQDYFDQAITSLKVDLKEQFTAIKDQFNSIRERFDRIDVELSALKEMVAVRQELNNLVIQLRGQGIEVDESKIFYRSFTGLVF